MSEILKIPYIATVIKYQTHDLILDVGCAPGGLGSYLRNNGYKGQLVGIDQKPLQDEARNFYDKFLQKDVEKWSNEILFDAIVCSEVIQYLRDPWATITQLVHSLKPGGKFYMSVPNVANYEFISNFILGTAEYGKGSERFNRDVLRWFNRTSAQELMLSASLSVDECIDVFANDADKKKLIVESKELMAVSNTVSGNRLMVPPDLAPSVIVSNFVLVGRRF